MNCIILNFNRRKILFLAKVFKLKTGRLKKFNSQALAPVVLPVTALKVVLLKGNFVGGLLIRINNL